MWNSRNSSGSATTRKFTTADSWPDSFFPPANKAALEREAARRRRAPARVEVRIADYRSTVVRVVRRGELCRVSVHSRLAAAPPGVFAAAVRCVWDRLDRQAPDPEDVRALAAFLRDHRAAVPPPTPAGSAAGRHVDLAAVCRSVNARFFGGQAPVVGVMWTPRRSFRRLADCHPEAGIIRVSRLLDSPRVPPYYIEYLIYHELLHLVVPPVMRGGRRCFHHLAFQRLERRFPQYREAREYQEQMLLSLARAAR